MKKYRYLLSIKGCNGKVGHRTISADYLEEALKWVHEDEIVVFVYREKIKED